MTSNDTLAREVGKLQGQMEAMQSQVGELSKDMHAMLATLNQAKGGWKTLLMTAGLAGAAGAAVTKLTLWFGAMPK